MFSGGSGGGDLQTNIGKAFIAAAKFEVNFHCVPSLSKAVIYSVLQTNTGKAFKAAAKFDNQMEVTFYRQGGILNYVARKML